MNKTFVAAHRSTSPIMKIYNNLLNSLVGIALLFLLMSFGCATGPLKSQPFNGPRKPARMSETPLTTNAQKTIQTVAYQESIPPPQLEKMIPEHPFQQPDQSTHPPLQQMQPMSGNNTGPQQNLMRSYQTPMNSAQQQSNPWNSLPIHQRPPVAVPNVQDWEPPPAPLENSSRPFSPRPGVNVRGAEFRIPAKTATELMVDLKDENNVLRNQLAALKNNIAQLNGHIQSEQQARKEVEGQLAEKIRQGKLLREWVAKLQVEAEDLETEKLEIERNADKALRKIEANLDEVLMNTLSTAREANTLNDQNR